MARTTGVWRTSVVWLLVVVAGAGCAGVGGGASTAPPSMTQRLAEANALVQGGRYAEARAAYAAILFSASHDDEALLGLSRLALNPLNPERNDREAATYLDRLIAAYPQSPLMAEARTWRGLIQTVERQQRELRRYQQDVERLTRELRREQQDTVRLREERERLRRIDEELERPRSVGVPATALPGWR
jgi:outer membrane protein assembly factor BamD (BamD/ComL family)